MRRVELIQRVPATVRIVSKDVIRFDVPADAWRGAVEIEVRIRPDHLHGWTARATMLHPDPPRRVELTRMFRSKDRNVAAGKMIGWIRGRYPRARPLVSGRVPSAQG